MCDCVCFEQLCLLLLLPSQSEVQVCTQQMSRPFAFASASACGGDDLINTLTVCALFALGFVVFRMLAQHQPRAVVAEYPARSPLFSTFSVSSSSSIVISQYFSFFFFFFFFSSLNVNICLPSCSSSSSS